MKDCYWQGMLKGFAQFIAFFLFVLLVNHPAVSFEFLHPEAVPAYIINSKITSWSDLLAVYLHPQMLYPDTIPYFRPSNNFLIPKAVTFFFGWHNLQGFLIANLFFLALIGLLFIKIYQQIFPKRIIGGYIAFGLYLMHPALIVDHLMVLQFDYCYVFFSLLSLYCFILFCQKRNSWFLGVATWFFYVFSVTFKEIAVLLPAVMLSYFLASIYQKDSPKKILQAALQQSTVVWLMIVLAVSSVLMAWYVAPPRQYHIDPVYIDYVARNIWNYFQLLLGILKNKPSTGLFLDLYQVKFPFFSRLIILFFWVLLVATIYLLRKKKFLTQDEHSLFFLLISAGIFLPMLFFLGGWPWHLNLTVVFLSLAMGFSADYLLQSVTHNQRVYYVSGGILAGLLGISLIFVIHKHTDDSMLYPRDLIALNRNAVLHPPNLRQLTAHSVLVVADKKPVGWYSLGDGFYLFKTKKELEKLQAGFFWQLDPIYNGTLFRWAYLMPTLKEQIHPFDVNRMEKVSDEVIQHWLLNYEDIFCVSYDEKNNWHDLTRQFKENLLKEKKRRRLPH